ncbi:hypothetical protein CRE_09599 [Caenorhabditis remanei]|uniref:F-box associated domain-containing protein n=1 Tax=Caenorhabditis remanei TaxID=31234 RepID=E3MJ86_CAERE|nr:hypothetical protein CRE_09599 [Caenorhabditis remanei]
MTKPWTFLSLKAVFEYMDGNKRLELNSHCPALRSVELSAPLNLQSVTLENDKIVVNNVCYKVKSTERIKTILDGRKEVRVEFLKIRNSSVLPDNLKIRTRSLDSGDIDLEVVLPFIKRTSFPLNELRVNISKTPNLKEYLGFTLTLILFETNNDGENGDLVRSILYDRKSPNIVLENISLSSNTTVTLIQNWKNYQKDIGTVLTMQDEYWDQDLPDLDEILEASNGRIVYFYDSIIQNKMDRRCISFPFNETSEVILYTIRDGPNGKRRTKLEVLPIGSTGPGTLFDTFIDSLSLFIVVLLLIDLLLLLLCSLI